MIESINGRRKYRISPSDQTVVQMQPKHGARWLDYRQATSLEQATALVLVYGRQDETQELEAVSGQ